jgi:taurine dioxygenase
MHPMQINFFPSAAGAEITGVDLSRGLDPADVEKIRDTVTARGMVVIREQTLTPEQFVNAGRGFGTLEDVSATTREFLMPGHPEITMISNMVKDGKPVGVKEAGQYWHTDRSWIAHPCWSSMLYARQVPRADDGSPLGETLFSNMVAACEALDPEMRTWLETLKGWHQYIYRFTYREERDRMPGVEQPVIIEHPISGKKCLYVNEGFTHRIVGMPETESKQLLARLFEHVAREDFVHTHRWNEGDFVMWDNFSVQHRAIGNYNDEQHRLLWRTTVQGHWDHHGLRAASEGSKPQSTVSA